ncbi:hypothetical protein BCT30_11935 [Enterovibrio norvegicus]|nr:hypothetical protein BCU46_16870 [Enterovibrio norvegicus]PMN52988.1 hypothetical protein BCT30_11935 [Enterovibrio norvegicus]
MHLMKASFYHNLSFYEVIMRYDKCGNEKIRQSGVFPHTSRLVLENLWKTLDMIMVTFAFANKEWGRNVPDQIVLHGYGQYRVRCCLTSDKLSFGIHSCGG